MAPYVGNPRLLPQNSRKNVSLRLLIYGFKAAQNFKSWRQFGGCIYFCIIIFKFLTGKIHPAC